MGKFVVSARKYRPQQFEGIQGQEHIVKTLKNAIKGDKIANAYLFCGPKGSGKTTSARLLAKAANCLAVTEAGEPCSSCQSCQQYPSFNIYELDAASHNSAEEMRRIVEQVKYHPPSGKKKVMIIDEVHMLSNAAFNVLLKPLEDTLDHVVFILVTTEKHKILPTILSRCQIFNFHPVEAEKIFDQLRYVAKQENILYEEEALQLISEKAMGSLRDALSMFDMIAVFSGDKKIAYEATLSHLHLLDESVYHDMIAALYDGHVGEALVQYHDIVAKGFEGLQFLNGLCEYLRNLFVAQMQEMRHLLSEGTSLQKSFQKQAKDVSSHFIYEGLVLAQACALHYKASPHQRLHVELMLMKVGRINGGAILPVMGKSPANSAKVIKKEPDAAAPSPSKPVEMKKVQAPPARQTPQLTSPLKQEVKERSPEHVAAAPAASRTRTIRIPKKEELVEKMQQKATLAAGMAASEQGVPAQVVPLKVADVQEHWKAYEELLRKKESVMALSALQAPFRLEEGNVIVVNLRDEGQQGFFETLKPALLSFLKKRLSAHALQIKATFTLQKKEKKPYSDDEKLADLVRSNPEVANLQKALQLYT
jgi:DNA polymerase-3 subunit gamma/tau